jgi:hypothetical protein
VEWWWQSKRRHIFSKAEPIKLEENEAEVVAKLGQFDVKKKLKPKDMVVNGKLEL